MKPSEILRNLADMIDARQQNNMSVQEPETIQSDEPEVDTGLAHAPDDIFLPPLQMKLELLKKATGVDNVYDEESAEEEQSNGYDELEHIKRNAGINVVALDALGDDEPLEG
jgi:hypothetical protein